jgi:large subunit ribosomal protein L3
MALGLVGRKCGMTRIFSEDGTAEPVSVVYVESHRVVQVKDVDVDGYSAVQVTTGSTKRSSLTKAEAGHYGKVGVEAGIGLWEFNISQIEISEYKPGQEYGLELFEEGGYVDVRGISIGKGFAGVIKRYNFRTQDATHGNSLSHRAPGSIGQNQTPGRVFKGKKMAGHMGSRYVTTQNLKICAINIPRSIMLIRGAIPGHKGSNVVIKAAEKK